MRILKTSFLLIILALIFIPLLSHGETSDSKTISLEKTEIYEDAKIRVTYTGAEDKDWIGIYPRGGIPGANDGSGNVIGSLLWGYLYDVDGEFVFMDDIDPTSRTDALTAGEYDLYYLKNDGYEVAAKIEFTILEGEEPNKLNAPAEITYTRTATVQGYAKGNVTIKKPSDGPDIDEYILYWANANGKLKGYSPIAVIKAKGDVTQYAMPDSLFIPNETTNIIAYSKNKSKLSEEYASAKVDASALLKNETKLYSLNILSDIHIGAAYDANLERALKAIINKDPNSIGVFTVGDNTESGKTEQYKKLMNTIDTVLKDKKLPVYFSLGNHDMSGTFNNQVNLFKEQTKMEGVYHHTIINDTYFIHLGNEDPEASSKPALISETQMEWLEDLLKEASEKKGPIFIFLHQPIYNTVAGSLPGQGWDGVKDAEKLRNLLDQYPNAMLFTGHTHWKFDSVKTMLNGNGTKANYFNCSSVAYLWTDEDKHYDGSQGYFVEVYKDYVLVKGWDFELEEWSSCAQFMLMIDSDAKVVAPVTTSTPKTTEPSTVKDNKFPLIPVTVGAILIVAVVLIIILRNKRLK